MHQKEDDKDYHVDFLYTCMPLLELNLDTLFPHVSGRKCLYDDKAVKYLVQVKDDVEAGDEKMKELEQEMKDWGIFDTDFCLGDVFDDDEDTPGSETKPKKRICDWPVVEGEESVVEYVGAYKKARLSKKALIKKHQRQVGEGPKQGT